MTTSSPDNRTVFAAVALANRAPAPHHGQPWRWLVGNHSVHLMAATAHRDVLLGCGAALHHLQVAFAALGWGTAVHRIPNEHDLDHLAAVALRPCAPTPEDVALADAIARRRTDRRRYTSRAVPAEHLDVLTRAAARAGALLVPVPDRQLELATSSGPVWHEAPPPNREDGELLVLTTPRDDPLSVLRAGEAMSAVLLAATDLGLASCPLPPEDSWVAVRVGWAPTSAPPLPQVPVRRTEDTVDYLPGTHKPVHP